jgi:hypothetical protein
MLLTQKPQLMAMAPLKIENFLRSNTLKRSHGFPPSQLSKSVFRRVHSVYGTNNMMSYSFLFLYCGDLLVKLCSSPIIIITTVKEEKSGIPGQM